MTGEDVRQVCAAILPHEDIDRLCGQCGVMERPRKRHLRRLVRAMVIAAGTPGGAYQADILRSSLEFEAPRVARSAFSRGVDEPRERFMAVLADQALASARAPQVDLAGPLGGVQAWDIVDAPTVKGRDALQEEFPGAGEDAAIKGHQVLSVGRGAPVRDHCSPAREHDSRHLEIEASWRGRGRLVDLASARLVRLRACHAPGVRVVLRLQEHWTPKGDALARGPVTPACFPGTDLDGLLEQDILGLDGRAIEADGPVGGTTHPLHRRLVGVKTPNGDGVFLTNLPPRVGPRPVADRYRVRWEVERRLRLDKSVHRLDPSDAERPWSVKTLLPAARIASMIPALRAHTPKLQTRPPPAGAPRTEAPLPPRRLALQLAVSCQSIAQAFDRQGAAAKRRWQQMAERLTHAGRDPNWRRRPSILDQLRGWTRPPLARKQARDRDLQAAA